MRGNKSRRDTGCRAVPLATALILLLACFVAAPRAGGQESSESAQNLLRRVMTNELNAEQQDQSHWKFRLETQKPNGQPEVDEVIETKDGDLKRPILINGRELTAEQEQKVEKGIQQVVRNPAPLRKERAQEDEDAARSQRLLKMLPDAFGFSYGQRRGDFVQLNFSPNPKFHVSTHEAEVFHATQGVVWVDSKKARLEEINGRLMHEVKFVGGLLGHLNQGGTFQVKQANVAPGYWELTFLKVQMRGKALFFKTIGVQENYTRSDFKQVPDSLTLAQAAEMLEQQKPASLNSRLKQAHQRQPINRAAVQSLGFSHSPGRSKTQGTLAGTGLLTFRRPQPSTADPESVNLRFSRTPESSEAPRINCLANQAPIHNGSKLLHLDASHHLHF